MSGNCRCGSRAPTARAATNPRTRRGEWTSRPGQVRWTEGRNFEAVLDLLARGRLQVADLVTHTFGIAEAEAAYQLIERRAEPYLAIRLVYPGPAGAGQASSGGAVRLKDPPRVSASPGIGWAGAGAFSTGTLLPAFRAAGIRPFRRGGLGQRAVRPPGRRAARFREGGAGRRCASW